MLRDRTAAAKVAAVADMQDIAHTAIYPNEALSGTPLEDIYGANVRLKQIQKEITLEDVTGLVVFNAKGTKRQVSKVEVIDTLLDSVWL